MKGWELLKEIAEGNIKEGTIFKMIESDKYFYYDGYEIKYKNGNADISDGYTITAVTQSNFEIVEEENTINIQDIEGIDLYTNARFSGFGHQPTRLNCEEEDTNWQIISDTINTIIKAIQQLDKEIKENKNGR